LYNWENIESLGRTINLVFCNGNSAAERLPLFEIYVTFVRNKVASRKRFIELYNLEIFEMILFYINLGFHNKNRDKFLHCAHNIILVNKSFAMLKVSKNCKKEKA
jgi:hypothetical protein